MAFLFASLESISDHLRLQARKNLAREWRARLLNWRYGHVKENTLFNLVNLGSADANGKWALGTKTTKSGSRAASGHSYDGAKQAPPHEGNAHQPGHGDLG